MKQLQQGDVIITKLEELPDGDAVTVSPGVRGHVLADGEITGHAHVIPSNHATMTRIGAKLYITVLAPTRVTHEEHKPLDLDPIRAEAAKTGRLVVTLENHTIVGGLGEAVAAALMRAGIHPAFDSIALPDEFLDAGALPTLHDQYGLSVRAITERVRARL